MDLENIRQQIVENKLPLTYILYECLNFVEMHPEYASQIGSLWNSNIDCTLTNYQLSNLLQQLLIKKTNE